MSRVTLNTVAGTARILYRVRYVLIAIAVAAGAWFGLSVIQATGDSSRSLLALTVLLWAGLGLGTAYTLPRLPASVAPGDPFGRRLLQRLQLAAYLAGCVVLLGTAGFAAFLTYRALRLGFGA